jgi:hypothetical protein
MDKIDPDVNGWKVLFILSKNSQSVNNLVNLIHLVVPRE